MALGDGDTYQFGATEMRVFDTPGHTRGHVTLWFPQAQALFPGKRTAPYLRGKELAGHKLGRCFGWPKQANWELLLPPARPPTLAICCPWPPLATGDTLFALGCGRLFEGHPEQMWASLSKLMKLPPETQVYCAHEYTQARPRQSLDLKLTGQLLM